MLFLQFFPFFLKYILFTFKFLIFLALFYSGTSCSVTILYNIDSEQIVTKKGVKLNTVNANEYLSQVLLEKGCGIASLF